MLQAARCFAASRMALPRLLAYYDSVQSQVLRQQLEFPYSTLHQVAEAKCTVDMYSGSAACVSRGLFSRMASLCSSTSVGHRVLLHIRQWQLQDMQLHFPCFEQLVQGWLLIVQEPAAAVSWDETVDKPVEC